MLPRNRGKGINDLSIVVPHDHARAYTNCGWTARTMDAAFLMKPQYEDLVIEVTF